METKWGQVGGIMMGFSTFLGIIDFFIAIATEGGSASIIIGGIVFCCFVIGLGLLLSYECIPNLDDDDDGGPGGTYDPY